MRNNVSNDIRRNVFSIARSRRWLAIGILCSLFAHPMMAEQRFIVRMQSTSTTTTPTSGGLLGGLVGGTLNLVGSVLQGLLNTTCQLLGCQVKYSLDGSIGQLYLVSTADTVDPATFLAQIQAQPGVADAEQDVLGSTLQSSSTAAPAALYDRTPVNYYGVMVREGYVKQPAVGILRLPEAQNTFHVDGAGIVAVIDTGVDSQHPVLKGSLVPGYDFTRNTAGIPDESSDLDQSTAAVVDQSTAAVVDGAAPAQVNQSTAACVDQSTAAVVDNQKYAAFGHGTMVAGVIHLTAPRAMIMPLKAFHADGTGYLSDILRAVYFAVQNNAKVLNMSFSFTSPSRELYNAMAYANQHKVIPVAAVGNDGQRRLVYPAAYPNVIGVASTTNFDTRSQFSNYGVGLVFVAAPGEGIVTTYPFHSWAAAWGTSFSTPFVAGTAALLSDVRQSVDESSGGNALSRAKWISLDMGYGRMDIYRAVQAISSTWSLF